MKTIDDTDLVFHTLAHQTRRLYLNAMPVQAIHERWIDGFSAYWADRLSCIKQAGHVTQTSTARKEEEEQD